MYSLGIDFFSFTLLGKKGSFIGSLLKPPSEKYDSRRCSWQKD